MPGEEPGDFSGMPINEAARMFGDSLGRGAAFGARASVRAYTLPYMFFGPNQFRIWEGTQPRTRRS